MRIAIIGAGFAGLVTAKVLRQYHHDVTVYEKAPDVGGVWSAVRRYPGLSTQNNRDSYCLSDLPWPSTYPEWPHGEHVQTYLEAYTRLFNLEDVVHLSTEVVSARDVSDDPANSRWEVRTRPVTWDMDSGVMHQEAFAADDAASMEDSVVEEFDAVVVANGIFSRPFIPTFEGQEEFLAGGGQIWAPSQLRSAEEWEGKDVLVLGYGKSACDIAFEVADTAPRSTTVVARQLIWKVPKMILGKLNFKYLLMTRQAESLFEYQHPTPFEKVFHGPLKFVRDGMLNGVQWATVRTDRLDKIGLVPHGKFERVGRSTVSNTTAGFFDAVHDGKLRVIRETHVTRLGWEDGAGYADLSSGERVPADFIIAATGWCQEAPFLGPEVEQQILDERGNFALHRYILPHDVPGLFFCGYNSSFFSPLSAEAAAWWIAEYLDGGITVPPVAERRRSVAERLRWMEWRTENHHARGTNVVPFSMHTIDEKLADMGLKVTTGQRVGEWLNPVDPTKYQWVTKTLLERHAERQARRGHTRSDRRSEMDLAARR